LQRRVIEEGRRNRWKAYRYGDDGVSVVRRKPAEGEKDSAPDTWTRTTVDFDPFPGWAGRGLRVSEAGALFYLVSAADLDAPGRGVEMPVHSSDGMILARVQFDRRERQRVDLLLHRADGTRIQLDGRREVVRLSLTGMPMEGGRGGKLEFAGLQGDVEILVDRSLGLPVEVKGKVPVVGTVRVRLVEAFLH